ncbi:MAG: hypothetical protein JSS04_21395 [Proteobacteria bacterium]|nr:hypothetical protein [Pseudomonadota bacterium]
MAAEPIASTVKPLVDRPEMMAIGDSLYNGMRSFTIDATKAALSPPAMIASALGIRDFGVPDLPQPVVVQLEEWIHWLSPIIALPTVPGRLEKAIRESVRFWATVPGSPSGAQGFENIAFAGATVEHLYSLTPASAAAQAATSATTILGAASPFDALDAIGDFLLMANARFTLSPLPNETGNPFWNMTPLQIVAHRKPKRLIVSIGHNDGFVDIVLRAASTGADRLEATLEAVLPTFARQLTALPPEVERIYYNLLPKPSAVSALMPLPDMAEEKGPAPDSGYWPGGYENRIGWAYGQYQPSTSGVRSMASVDKAVHDINDWIVRTIKTLDTANRVAFVDNYALMEEFDSKNHPRTADNVVVAHNVTHSNRMFQADLLGLRAGGLESLDGIHLTAVGNAVMANHVLKSIAATEKDAAGNPLRFTPPSYDLAHRADTLLSNPPSAWAWVLWLYRDLRRDGVVKTVSTSTMQRRVTKQVMDVAMTVGSRMHGTGSRGGSA